MSTMVQTIKAIGRTFGNYTDRAGGIKMRPYQLEPAKAILDSILNKRGHTIVVIISRQSGKDELLANLLSYLMTLFAHREVGIVIANPTYKPQTINAIMRLENRLKANLLTKGTWKKRSDYMRMIGTATTSFLSGDNSASVVGATASLLLVINEAQDISPAKFDKDFAPMVASTNATRLIVGTVWTSDTLLARELQSARAAQEADGFRRVFVYTSDDVRQVVPAYGKHVDNEVQRLGRQHPLVKTQYFCETIDAQAGMFSPARRALMIGDQNAQDAPSQGHIYGMCIDVAGMDEALLNLDGMGNPGRDSTSVTIVDVDLSFLDTLQAPIYRAVNRIAWQGQSHMVVFGKLAALIAQWRPMYIVIDATGVGEGLWAMLEKKYPTRVIPVKFSQQEKSEIGWRYLAIIETGRFRDCCVTDEVRIQYDRCQSEILPGPAKTLRWGVKDGTRGPDGELVHDDIILSDALCAKLDEMQWMVSSPTLIVEPRDVFRDMDRNY